jgi:hypothetical protein
VKRKKAAKRPPRQARQRPSGFGVYTPRERAIYRYCGGCGNPKCKGCRAQDPIEIQQQLLDFPELDLETDTKIFSSELIPEKEKMAAFNRLVAAARKAFAVTPFNRMLNGIETGLTNGEVMSLLLDFASWLEDLKKKHGILPTSAKPMEAAPSAPASTTPASADSGSTATAPSVVGPPPPPPASLQPSGPICQTAFSPV